MIDRQLAWSNPEVTALVPQFVPCADEVFRLQNGDDAECALFQRFCDEGHYRAPKNTRQGLYIVTPNGKLLGSANQRDPRRIAQLMRQALTQWQELKPAERSLTAEDRQKLESFWRWEREFPEDGLALVVTTRDLPRADQERPRRRRWDWRAKAWNTDTLWYRLPEARGWVPAEPEVGAEREVPDRVFHRLVRFNLVDNVRGQTGAYRAEHIKKARMMSRVTGVDGPRVTLELSGESHAEVPGEDGRGFIATLSGTAVWDREAARFESFQIVAEGKRWGATRFNERRRDRGTAPIGVVIELAAADRPRVAPAFIWNYGWRPRHR